jgi:hypothetical protein
MIRRMHMKKILSLLAIVILSFIIYKPCAHALSEACTAAEKTRLRELATATKISYEYIVEPGINEEFTKRYYKVTVSNFKADFYVYNETNGMFISYKNDNTATYDLYNGGTYLFPFYGATGTACDGYLITTKNIQIIEYNPYSSDPLCKGHENYELCKKFTNIKVDTYDEFKLRVAAYIKSLDKKDDDQGGKSSDPDNTIWDNIKNFITHNYMIILISIIVVGITSIVLIEVKKRRNIL